MPTTFKDLQDIVLDLMEQEDSITRDRVKSFINMAGHDIWNRFAWNERRKVALLETEGPYKEGTVDVTEGSPTVTGTGVTWQTAGLDDEWKFALGTGNPWYGVVTVDSETSLTLDQNYLEPSLVGQTYLIYKDVLKMPLAAQTILHVTSGDPNRGGVLSPIARIDLDALAFLPRTEGVPVQYATQEEIGGQPTFRIWPIPDRAYRIQVTYLDKWIELDADLDVPQLSEDKRDLIVLGALKWGYLQAFETGKAQVAEARYERDMRTAWSRDKRRTPLSLVMRKFDDWSAWRNPLQLPFRDSV